MPSHFKKKASFSTVKSSAHVETGGDPRFYRPLVEAFKAPFKDKVTAKSLTHPLHSYPARMHPATAKICLEMAQRIGKFGELTVLDPFVGSGTTMVETTALGGKGIGIDLNPLACLLAKTKSSPKSKAYRKELLKTGLLVSEKAIAEGKAARRSGYESPPPFSPPGLSKKKRDQILKGWFSRHVRAELEFLVSLITELKSSDPLVKDALKICLSSVVVKASNQESDSQKTARAKHIGRGACARWFKSRVDLLCQGLNDLSQSPNQETEMFLSNAADIKELGIKSESVNVVCTSPPYLGTYDYVEHHDLRAALLGLPLEDFRAGELGSRRDFDKNGAKEFKASKGSMAKVFEGIEDVLVSGGLAMFVMGDSLAGGRYVLADEFLLEASGKLEKVAWASQPRKKWGLKEAQIFGSQVKKEHIVVFRKP